MKANEAEVIKIWNLVLVETNRRLIDQSTVLRDLDFIPCKGWKSQKKKIVGKPSFKLPQKFRQFPTLPILVPTCYFCR
jgi:hypothetical protein